MDIVVGLAVIGAVVWAAAPWVAMARHGTVDTRTVAGWRSDPVVPAPRRAADDDEVSPIRCPASWTNTL